MSSSTATVELPRCIAGGIGGVDGQTLSIPPGGTHRRDTRARRPKHEHGPASPRAGAARSGRVRRRALRDRLAAPDGDGLRPRRTALRRAGDGADRRRGRGKREAAHPRARVQHAARPRLERAAPLRLVARPARQPQPPRQVPGRAPHAAEGVAVRPPPAGQRRRRQRRPPLLRLGLDVRRLRGEGPAQRDHPLGAPERSRGARRRARVAQPLRALPPAGHGTAVRHRERAGRSRERRAGRGARTGRAGPQLRLAGLLAELRAQAARRQGLRAGDPARRVPRAAFGRGRASRSHATAAPRSSRSGVSTSAGSAGARSCGSRSTPTAASRANRCSHVASSTRSRCSSLATARCSSRTGERGGSTESRAKT